MAALEIITTWEMIQDDDEEELLYQFKKIRNTRLVVWLINSRRDSVPNVDQYMSSVIHLLDLPENIDDFKYHFRVSRDLFNAVLNDIHPILLRQGTGPEESVEPEKQLLVCLCYLANCQSMREVAHTFNLSKGTVHGIIGDVCKALYQLVEQVRSCYILFY